MAGQRERNRARFLLVAILRETRYALGHLYRSRPRIFARGFANSVIDHDRVAEVVERVREIESEIRFEKRMDWDSLEQVGLTGDPLEWKADLIYQSLGRRKPVVEQASLLPEPENEVITYPEGKPVWSRLFKYLKSLFESLINGISNNSKLRLILDFIREFIDCVDASLKFVQAGQEM